MEISFISVQFPYKRGNFYSVFTASSVSAVSQNKACAKGAYSGVAHFHNKLACSLAFPVLAN